jgi:uncharacterized protein (DUF1697 family)
MTALVAMFEGAGCKAVRSYIQSGNVLFGASPAAAARAARRVKGAIAAEFGYDIPVILRSVAELEAIAANTPFAGDEEITHVVFLADTPTSERADALDPERSPPDTFEVRGGEIYLRCPNGLGRSKLSNAWFDAKLETTSTIRNWRTLLKLIELGAAA